MNQLTVDQFYLYLCDIYNNNKYKIMCYGKNNTIEYLKFALSQIINIDKENIKIYQNNKELLDFHTLQQYSIDKNSVLKFSIKLNSCHKITNTY